jgi:tyrosinase
VDSQNPTPGIAPNSWLDLGTALNPFTRTVNGQEAPYTSRDCINIAKQLGFTYSTGSLDDENDAVAALAEEQPRAR